MNMRIEIILLGAALALSGCSTGRSSIADESPPPQTADNADLGEPAGPEPDIDAQPVDPPPKPVITASNGPLAAKEIMAALANKTFKYAQGPKSGTISYFSDGTFTYIEGGRGEATGVWQASDGKLCEALDPSDSLPKGTRSECHPFTASNGAYQTGPKRLSPA
jgi:hypothetical protein